MVCLASDVLLVAGVGDHFPRSVARREAAQCSSHGKVTGTRMISFLSNSSSALGAPFCSGQQRKCSRECVSRERDSFPAANSLSSPRGEELQRFVFQDMK